MGLARTSSRLESGRTRDADEASRLELTRSNRRETLRPFNCGRTATTCVLRSGVAGRARSVRLAYAGLEPGEWCHVLPDPPDQKCRLPATRRRPEAADAARRSWRSSPRRALLPRLDPVQKHAARPPTSLNGLPPRRDPQGRQCCHRPWRALSDAWLEQRRAALRLRSPTLPHCRVGRGDQQRKDD